MNEMIWGDHACSSCKWYDTHDYDATENRGDCMRVGGEFTSDAVHVWTNAPNILARDVGLSVSSTHACREWEREYGPAHSVSEGCAPDRSGSDPDNPHGHPGYARRAATDSSRGGVRQTDELACNATCPAFSAEDAEWISGMVVELRRLRDFVAAVMNEPLPTVREVLAADPLISHYMLGRRQALMDFRVAAHLAAACNDHPTTRKTPT